MELEISNYGCKCYASIGIFSETMGAITPTLLILTPPLINVNNIHKIIERSYRAFILQMYQILILKLFKWDKK